MVKLTSKPNPIIEKIELTEEQKQEVQDLMDGKPTIKQIERWDRQGKRDWYEKHYHPSGLEKDRLREIRKKYYKNAGKCMVCHKLPLYKVTHKMDGISLVAFYCDNCFEKWKDRL